MKHVIFSGLYLIALVAIYLTPENSFAESHQSALSKEDRDTFNTKIPLFEVPLGTEMTTPRPMTAADCELLSSIAVHREDDIGAIASSGPYTITSLDGGNNNYDMEKLFTDLCNQTKNKPRGIDVAGLVKDHKSSWVPRRSKISGTAAWALAGGCKQKPNCAYQSENVDGLGCGAQKLGGKYFVAYKFENNCEAAVDLHRQICKAKLDPRDFRSVCYKRK